MGEEEEGKKKFKKRTKREKLINRPDVKTLLYISKIIKERFYGLK